MKQVKPTSTEQCGYCKATGSTVRAQWRSSFLSSTKYACDLHKPTIVELEQKELADNYMSEADYQTWGKL